MSKTTAVPRAAGRRRSRQRKQRRRSPAFGLAIGLILALGVLATVLARGTAPPEVWGTVSVAGPLLPTFQAQATDPAVGEPVPDLSGEDFDGNAVTITADGRAKVILVLAHWCVHCQREVPWVQEWVGAGRLPADVDLYSVASAIDPGRPNYPPDRWLERESWTPPVLVDSRQQTAGEALGVSSYPFWVFVDATGKVLVRHAGALPPDTFDQLAAGLASASGGSVRSR